MEKRGFKKPQRASGGEIHPWKEGLSVEGQLLGIKKLPDRKDAKDNVQQGGHLMTLDTLDGIQVWGVPTLLLEMISNVPQGTHLHIYCLGQVVPSGRGQMAWDFEVTSKDQMDAFRKD